MSRLRVAAFAIALLLVAGTILAFGSFTEIQFLASQFGAPAISPTYHGNPHSTEGDDSMVTERKLVHTVTSRPEKDTSRDHVHIDSNRTPITGSNTPSSSSIFPSYLPVGISLLSVDSFDDLGEEILHFAGDDGRSLTIMLAEGGVASGGLPVLEGRNEAVTIGQSDSHGQFIRGAWHRLANGQVEWDQEVMSVLLFERADDVVVLLALPGPEWSKEELTRVANSLGASS